MGQHLAVAGILTLAGLIVATVEWACASGRLGRNPIAGLRLPALYKSDEAWRIGHRAAAVPMSIAAILLIGSGPISAFVRPNVVWGTGLIIICALVAGAVVWAAVVAERAAR